MKVLVEAFTSLPEPIPVFHCAAKQQCCSRAAAGCSEIP